MQWATKGRAPQIRLSPQLCQPFTSWVTWETCPLTQQFTSFHLSGPSVPENPRKKPSIAAAFRFKSNHSDGRGSLVNGCRLGVSGLQTGHQEFASGLVCAWAVPSALEAEPALPNHVPLDKPLPLCLSLCLCQRQTGILPSLFEVRIDSPCESAEPQRQCFFCLSLMVPGSADQALEREEAGHRGSPGLQAEHQ